MSSPTVLALVAEAKGPEWWRVFSPFAALQAQGVQAWWLSNRDPALLQAAVQSEALLLPRLSWPPEMAAHWAAQNHARGLALIYDADDDMFSEACLPTNAAVGALVGKDAAQVERERQDRIATLRVCDGVTVPTEALAAVVRQYTARPVVVVPNAIDWTWWQAQLAAYPRTEPRLTIGWAGGRRLASDVEPLAEAWAQIAARYPDVVFKLAGYQPPCLVGAVPPDRLIRDDWEPLATYPRAYAHVDIGCCPLAATPFNACKSPIKAYEWAAVGAAVVASPTVYGDVLRDGRHGLIADTAGAWTAALIWLIEEAALRQQMAARWAKRVQERYSLTVNLAHWPDAWAAILDDFRRAQIGRMLVAGVR